MESDALFSLIPTGSVGTILALIIIHLFRQNSADRKNARDEISVIQAEHAAEVKRMSERHEAQMARVEQEIRELRDELKAVMAQLEAERRARWEAEDELARTRRNYGIGHSDSARPREGS